MPPFAVQVAAIECGPEVQPANLSGGKQSHLDKLQAAITAASNKSSSRPKVVVKHTATQVNFGNVTIRHYKQILGDHPDCRFGPPVTLDWDYEEDSHQPTVDRHQAATKAQQQRRRRKKIPHSKRMRIVQEQGVTSTELQKATRDLAKVQSQRASTRVFAPLFMPFSDAIETVTRRAKRVIASSSSSKQSLS